MPAIQDAAARSAILARIDRLTPQSAPAWGKMNVSQMLAHLNDALRMTFGELPVKDKYIPLLRSFPFKQLVLYVVPFPKGAATAPELLSRAPDSFESERAQCKALFGRFADTSGALRLAQHPIFGPLTPSQMGTLVHKHVDHHLRQFGV
jgi:Protein of unknown function (DUF1569)